MSKYCVLTFLLNVLRQVGEVHQKFADNQVPVWLAEQVFQVRSILAELSSCSATTPVSARNAHKTSHFTATYHRKASAPKAAQHAVEGKCH
jgi:hypothetical protein